jgi:integrase
MFLAISKAQGIVRFLRAPLEPSCPVIQFLCHPNHRAILTTCYGAGLRVPEASLLRLIDGKRMVLRVEQGETQKDRYVMLSPKLLEILRDWWRAERPRR